jgi:lysozyme
MPAKPDLSTALRYAATCVYGTEGFRDTAWLDTLPDPPVWTIGHGTTFIDDKPVGPGMICTRQEADQWAMEAMRETGEEVLAAVHVDLNAMQLGALISLAYNIGIGHFRRSSVLEALNLALYQVAANRFLEYDEAGHRVIEGLETRRGRERALFLTGMGIAHSPSPEGRAVRTTSEGRAVRTTSEGRASSAMLDAPKSDPGRPDADHSADALNAAELAKLHGED